MELNKCKCGGNAKVFYSFGLFIASCDKKNCKRMIQLNTEQETGEMWNAANPETAQELKDPCDGCDNPHAGMGCDCTKRWNYDKKKAALEKKRVDEINETLAGLNMPTEPKETGTRILIQGSNDCMRWTTLGDEKDPVQSPSHYTWIKGIECKDVVKHFSCFAGQAIQYIWRAGHKGDNAIEDLKKAQECLKIEIERLESEANNGKI